MQNYCEVFFNSWNREQQSPVAGLAMVNIQHVKGWNRRKGSLHRYCVLSNSGNQYCLTVLQTAEDSPSVAVSRLRHEQVCILILAWSSPTSFILAGDTLYLWEEAAGSRVGPMPYIHQQPWKVATGVASWLTYEESHELCEARAGEVASWWQCLTEIFRCEVPSLFSLSIYNSLP